MSEDLRAMIERNPKHFTAVMYYLMVAAESLCSAFVQRITRLVISGSTIMRMPLSIILMIIMLAIMEQIVKPVDAVCQRYEVRSYWFVLKWVWIFLGAFLAAFEEVFGHIPLVSWWITSAIPTLLITWGVAVYSARCCGCYG